MVLETLCAKKTDPVPIGVGFGSCTHWRIGRSASQVWASAALTSPSHVTAGLHSTNTQHPTARQGRGSRRRHRRSSRLESSQRLSPLSRLVVVPASPGVKRFYRKTHTQSWRGASDSSSSPVDWYTSLSQPLTQPPSALRALGSYIAVTLTSKT